MTLQDPLERAWYERAWDAHGEEAVSDWVDRKWITGAALIVSFTAALLYFPRKTTIGSRVLGFRQRTRASGANGTNRTRVT